MNLFLSGTWETWKKEYPSIQLVSLPDKAFLYRQGDCCSSFFWIKNGIVKLSHLTEQGNELTLALLKTGDIIGYLPGDFTNQVMEENAQALGKVDFYRLEYSDFKKLITSQPNLSWQILESVYTRKQLMERKLRAILTQSIEQRLIVMLLELAKLFGIRCTHGYALEISLTQQELADLVGASRPVVSTIMNQFRNRGILDYTREHICVNDTALLLIDPR